MNISHPDLCAGEDHKHTHTYTNTLKPRSAVDTVLHVLSEINISFALLLYSDADWHPFLRGQLRDMHTHTHTCAYTLPNTPGAHTPTPLRAVVCFD